MINCNGLGAVIPAVATGTAAPLSGPPSQTVNLVTMTVGGINAAVQFAGLVPRYQDLYQVNAVVPSGEFGARRVECCWADQSGGDDRRTVTSGDKSPFMVGIIT